MQCNISQRLFQNNCGKRMKSQVINLRFSCKLAVKLVHMCICISHSITHVDVLFSYNNFPKYSLQMADIRLKLQLCCIIHTVYNERSLTYLTETVKSVGTSRSRSGASVILYLTDGLLFTTASNKVWRTCFITCGSCHCRTTFAL